MRTLLATFLLLLCSPLIADYRDGYGGWTHAHDCKESKLPNCTPHHHILDKIGIEIATEKVLDEAIIIYHRTPTFPKKFIPEKNYEKLKEKLIEYFTENPKELLEVVPKSLGNAPNGCDYSPPKEIDTLEHSEEECERFKSGTPKPQLDPSKPRLTRPMIEDFIEEYPGNKTDKI
ncbi:MAG: hypothetical protein ACOH5I_07785 [Oligoflexus sp.]